MFVVCFFNLRLGWVLSGLIVPGYIVPLMLIKPWSAGVIFVESVATYFLVWFFSEYLSRRAPWSNFFGRDRFFALILCSIFIRLLFDGWLLPQFGEWLNQTLQLNFDYQNHLHSFGLIIVALIANQFWKTGFIRGMIPLAVIITVTALIVRYGLMEFTNFSLSNISYLYEDMASSILATPKAYIILISTAFLASRMNLKYGWDFNGILIPSLLALQWYQPIKILATIAEAGVILLIAELLLKTPWLKTMTIEGARKLLLFFNISFAYKVLLGYAVAAWFPEVKVTDYFGFGYLLSTLMAVKIHDKAILARLTRATLQTSLASVLFASVIGFTLTLLPISDFFISPAPQQQLQVMDNQLLDESLPVLLKKQEIQLYQAKVNDNFKAPLAHDLDAFSRAIKLLQSYLLDTDPAKLEQAANYLAQINYNLDIIQKRYLYLHEKPPLKGWGVYVFDLHNTSSLAVSIPAPLNERGMIDAGVTLFQSLQAGSLAISGSSRHAKADLSADVLHNKQTFFHHFHRLINRHDSLQIRGYSPQLARQLTGKRRTESDFEISGLSTTLWTKHHLPPSLNLIDLKQLVDDFRIEWTQPSFENQQRESSREGFAELILTQQAMRQLMFKPMLIKQQVDYVEQDKRLEGYLQEWILDSKDQIAAKGSELYQKPQPEELLFADEQVISPLLALVSKFSSKVGWSASNQEDLQVIAGAANAIGYQLIHYKDKQSKQQYLILTEPKKQQLRYWGTYVFRLGQSDNYLLQVPRPLYEINSFEFGIAFFERIKAQVLMIGATHPYANLDGSSDLIAPANVRNMFNLVNQVTLRKYPEKDMLVVNCRAFSYRADQPIPEADVMFALAQGTIEAQQLGGLTEHLLTQLKTDNISVQWVDGSEATTGYEVGGAAQAHYLKATENKNFATLWLSPLARATYRQQNQNYWQTAQFNALEVKTVEESLDRYVQRSSFFGKTQDTSALKTLLFDYMDNPDILRLQQVTTVARKQQYQLVRVLDLSTKQAFLVIHDSLGKVLAIANLMPRGKTIKLLDKRISTNLQIISFINQRNAWLHSGKNR
ncbi:MAG: poly-gamma-glutamate biosynthesis protein PgsC/CapC [Methylococcales bacterium]